MLLLGVASAVSAAEPSVTVLYDAPWSPGDRVRDGAAEMMVLMCAAGLQQRGQPAGIVGVGNCHGLFQPGTEAALSRVVCMGLPVVRAARDGIAPANDYDLFIDAGRLSAAEAKQLLAACLKRYGAPAAMADAFHPTKKELAALRAKLATYQLAFNAAASGTRVAVR